MACTGFIPLGGLSIAVPAEMKGLYQAWARFGNLEWNRLLEPVIKLCRDGIIVSNALARYIKSEEEDIRKEPGLRWESNTVKGSWGKLPCPCLLCRFWGFCLYLVSEIFLKPNGQLYKEGEEMKRLKLAKTLEVLAEAGAEEFYTGKLADMIVSEIQSFGEYLCTLKYDCNVIQ